MEFNFLIFALVIGLSGVLCEENKRPTNPIINLFEAPLKAFRTKPGEAVAVFEPQVVKARNGTATTGWYPGQAIGNAANSLTSWISQNTPLGSVLTTTTPEPDVIVQVQATQGNKKNNKKKKQPSLPDLNQLLQGDDDDDDDDDEEQDEEDEQSDNDENEEEDEKQFAPNSRPNGVGSIYRHGFRNGIRNQPRYGPNMPFGNRYRIGIRNGNGFDAQQFGQPNQFFDPLDQFYGPPRPQMYFGPLNYRPPVKRRKTGYNRRRPQQAMVYAKPKRKPMQVVLSPEMGGHLPILIPVQTLSLNSRPQKKKKKISKPMRPIITQNDEPDLGFTYVPIPLAQLNLASIGGPSMDSIPNLQNMQNMQTIPNLQSISNLQSIPAVQTLAVDSLPVPQLQILAQHTHTINQEPQIILSEEIVNRPSRPSRPARPTKSSRPSRPNPTRSPRPSQSDPWGETNTQHKFDPNRHKPVIVRISADQSSYNRPDVEQDEVDSYGGGEGYDNVPNPFISVGDVEDDEDETENKSDIQGRSEATSQYYIPQKYFPLLGSDSYLAVSNNGRFLLKTGRDLKIEQSDIAKEETVLSPKEDKTSINENVAEIAEESGILSKEAERTTPEEDEIVSGKLEKVDEAEIAETEQTDTKTTPSETEGKIEETKSETIEIIPVLVSSDSSENVPEETVPKLSLRTENLEAKPQVLLKEDETDTKVVQTDVKSILEKPSEVISSNPKIPAARSHLVPRGGLKYQEYELS